MQVTFNPLLRNLDYMFLDSVQTTVPPTVQKTEADNTEVNAVDNQPAQNVAPQPPTAHHAPHTPEAIATFMHKLGLEPTNSKEGDFALISARLAELAASAKTDEQKNQLTALQNEFSGITAQIGNAGQNHKAEMNKAEFKLKS